MSVLVWLSYALAVSLVLTLSAGAAEAASRAVGGGGRWPWLLALLGSAALPLIAWLTPAAPVLDAAVSAPTLVFRLAPVTMEQVLNVEPRGLDWQRLLLFGWLFASLTALGVILLSQRTLLRAARRWRQQQLEGTAVLVSDDVGPAVVGVLQPRIVVPAWLLALEPRQQRLMLLHEEQHRAAGDSRALLLALLLCAAVPWNPLMWLQLRRLRVAMELDCDERVLAHMPDPAGYGHLLLEVGRRRAQRHLLAAAFAEPRVLLERRVRALAHWPRARRPARAVTLALGSLLLLGGAWGTPPHTRTPLPATTVPPLPIRVEATIAPIDTPPPDPSARPVSTPMTRRPELQNPADLHRLLVRSYPPALRDAGVGGQVVVWLYVDTAGTVVKVLPSRSSGRPALDSAALVITRAARFSPARNGDRVVPVWIEVPVWFDAGGPAAERRGKVEVNTIPGGEYQTRALRNAAEVAALLRENYPPLLRDAGIGGTTVLAVYADTAGTVMRVQRLQSSGQAALDDAAMKAVSSMLLERSSEPGWVQVPVVFTAR